MLEDQSKFWNGILGDVAEEFHVQESRRVGHTLDRRVAHDLSNGVAWLAEDLDCDLVLTGAIGPNPAKDNPKCACARDFPGEFTSEVLQKLPC